MIDLKDGELIDIIPKEKADADSQARSYAIKQAIKLYVEKALNKTLLYTSIDTMPEDILDYMAVELDVSYYSQSMNIDMKRNVIKNAIPWYMTAGSTKAVEDMVNVIFGGGEVIEWYDFDTDKTPGYFDIETEAISSGESYQRISAVIKKVKNASSHLREVITRHEIEGKVGIEVVPSFDEKQFVTNDIKENNSEDPLKMKAIIAFTDAGIIKDSTLLFKEESYKEFDISNKLGVASTQDSISVITETTEETEFDISNKLGVASTQDSISVITETTEETEMVPEINLGIAAAFDQKTIIGG